MWKKLSAEALGTFWLVFGGVGTAVLAGKTVGWVGIALAFGLTVLTMVYALGRVSGGHFNPAVTVGAAASGRFATADVIPYVVAQVAGAIVASALILVVANGAPGGYSTAAGLGSNGFGVHSPGGYSLGACLLTELIMSFFFVFVVLTTTAKDAPAGFAGIAIGLCLTLIHLVAIPVTNTSVNPARSTGPALFAGGWALSQLWAFWLAPIAGGILAGVASRAFEAPRVPRIPRVEIEEIEEDAIEAEVPPVLPPQPPAPH